MHTSAFVDTNPDELEKNLIRAEVCGGERMRSSFAIASVRASAVSAGQRCSGRLLAIVPETFRAFTSFLK
jgi:hypothetical protein